MSARAPSRILAAIASVGLAACATAPAGSRVQMIGVPLAAMHSDLGFTVMGRPRPGPACADACATLPGMDADHAFALQTGRVAATLQRAAGGLYPDLAQRVPGLPAGGFDVYVVAGDDLGTESSADGRIAINASIGALRPYDEWLAFVIAREMGHVIARHHEENSAASITATILLNLLIPGSSLMKSAISAGGSGLAANSRRDVQLPEADAIAIALLQAAGFQLRDVSLALRVSLPVADDGTWSRAFRESSATLNRGLRAEALAIAAADAPDKNAAIPGD